MSEWKRSATVAERLIEAMREADVKQADLVAATGLNKSTISRYLSGQVEPKAKAVGLLAKALNVSEMWLFGYETTRNRTPEQKKNDAIVGAVQKMRSDPDFLEVVSQLAELPAGEYDSIKLLISSLRNK